MAVWMNNIWKMFETINILIFIFRKYLCGINTFNSMMLVSPEQRHSDLLVLIAVLIDEW